MIKTDRFWCIKIIFDVHGTTYYWSQSCFILSNLLPRLKIDFVPKISIPEDSSFLYQSNQLKIIRIFRLRLGLRPEVSEARCWYVFRRAINETAASRGEFSRLHVKATGRRASHSNPLTPSSRFSTASITALPSHIWHVCRLGSFKEEFPVR